MHGHRTKKNRPRRNHIRHYTCPTPTNPTSTTTSTDEADTDITTTLTNDWHRHHQTLTTLTNPHRDRGALLAASGAILAIEETLRGLGCPPPGGSWMTDKVA